MLVRQALARHGLHYEDIEHALLHAPHRWPRPATGDYGIRVLTVWLRLGDGTPLIVRIQQLDRPFQWIVLGARPMAADEAAEYQRWENTR